MPEKTGLPPPVCLAMVLCDHVWIDPATGKKTILGTFSAIHSPVFPITQRQFSIYVCLTDGQGTVPVRLRISDVDDERQPIFEAQEQLELGDPRAVIESVFCIRMLTFEQPGDYRVQLFAGNEFITERRVVVGRIPMPRFDGP